MNTTHAHAPSRALSRGLHRCAAVLPLFLAACAAPPLHPDDEAWSRVSRQTLGHSPAWRATPAQDEDARAATRPLLARPLSLDDAVVLAWARQPAWQARLQDAAADSADLAAAARLLNPRLSLERLSGGADGLALSQGLSLPLLVLLQHPARLERTAAAQAELRLDLLNDLAQAESAVRRAWVDAVAAAEARALADQALQSADARNELAGRMQTAGHTSVLQRSREQLLQAEALTQALQARDEAARRRTALAQALGLSADEATSLQLPARLPDLPDPPDRLDRLDRPDQPDQPDRPQAPRPSTAQPSPAGTDTPSGTATDSTAATTAPAASGEARVPGLTPSTTATLSAAQRTRILARRLDLQRARARVDAQAHALGLNADTPALDGLEAGVRRDRVRGQGTASGPSLTLPLPLFDTGDLARDAAAARLRASQQRLQAAEAGAALALQDAWAHRAATRALARHLGQQVLPLQQQVLDETLLRYNGMLQSVFELLDRLQAQQQARRIDLAARRDAWQAELDWQAAQLGLTEPAAPSTSSSSSSNPDAPRP